MSNDKEWKRAQMQYAQGNSKYQNSNNSKELLRVFKRYAKWIMILVIAIILLFSVLSPSRSLHELIRKEEFKDYGIGEVEETDVKTDFFGNGFYSYKLKEYPEVEIHAVSNISKKMFIEDTVSRITKYYFEKWTVDEKDNMIVEEGYQDYKHGSTKKDKWLLDYKIYLEANDYDDVMEATRKIIMFKEFTGIYKIPLPCYIRFKDKLIQPDKAGKQTDDQIIENVQLEYNRIISGNNENDDIQNVYDFMNQFS